MRRAESIIVPGSIQQAGAPVMEYLCPNPKCRIRNELMSQTHEVDLTRLSCLKKPTKERVTVRLDAGVVTFIRKFAKKNKVSCSELINQVLRKAFGIALNSKTKASSLRGGQG